MHRFKIDLGDSSFCPFFLFARQPCWHTKLTGLVWWKFVSCFRTMEDAKAYYDQIKDLPEYLD